METIAIITAAGTGTRCLSLDVPKQYHPINGKPIIRHTIEKFLNHPKISAVQVVINAAHLTLYEKAVEGLPLLQYVFGGATRQESIFNGLSSIRKLSPNKILLHDAVRPFVSAQSITAVIEALERYEAVDILLPAADTIKVLENFKLQSSLKREDLYHTQTPQAFRYPVVYELHEQFKHRSFNDDISMCLENDVEVGIVIGDKRNFKITTLEDLRYAEFLLGQASRPQALDQTLYVRTGMGLDIHRFENSLLPDNSIYICGVPVPHPMRVVAHSDGDVGLHAITEAILGSIAVGNIGMQFPSSDPAWKDASSLIFVKHANKLLREKGGYINSIDVTIICETPKVMPYSPQMQDKVAEALGLSPRQVSIKATTTEKMGFLGRAEGIAAQALCTVVLPVNY